MAFGDPEITVISAVDGTPYVDGEDMKSRMQVQVYSPVRWVQVINQMTAQGVVACRSATGPPPTIMTEWGI